MDFIATHVFREQGKLILDSSQLQQHYANIFSITLNIWQKICDDIPKEWWFTDEEMTIATDFDSNAAYQQLMRCTTQDFWTLS